MGTSFTELNTQRGLPEPIDPPERLADCQRKQPLRIIRLDDGVMLGILPNGKTVLHDRKAEQPFLRGCPGERAFKNERTFKRMPLREDSKNGRT